MWHERTFMSPGVLIQKIILICGVLCSLVIALSPLYLLSWYPGGGGSMIMNPLWFLAPFIIVCLIGGLFVSCSIGFVLGSICVGGIVARSAEGSSPVPQTLPLFTASFMIVAVAIPSFMIHSKNLDNARQSAFISAIDAKDLETMRLLADEGARVAEHLPHAVQSRSPAVVLFFLDRGADPTSVIIQAIHRGDTEIVGLLIKRGANVDARDQNGWSALRWAQHKKLQIDVEYSRQGIAPALWQESFKYVEIARMLQEAGAKDDFSTNDALIEAARNRNVRGVAEAIARGADPNDGRPLTHAAENGDIESVDLLLRAGAYIDATGQGSDDHSATPLVLAASRGHVSVVKRLVEAGADVRYRHGVLQTALYCAVKAQSVEMVGVLLEAGADPNDGSLARAAGLGDTSLVRTLIERGAKPDGGLMMAAQNGRNEIVLFLLERGANPNQIDGAKQTPLHHAAGHCKSTTVRALAAYGAVLDAQDISGTTPLLSAVLNDKIENIRTLIELGADVRLISNGHLIAHPEAGAELRRASAK